LFQINKDLKKKLFEGTNSWPKFWNEITWKAMIFVSKNITKTIGVEQKAVQVTYTNCYLRATVKQRNYEGVDIFETLAPPGDFLRGCLSHYTVSCQIQQYPCGNCFFCQGDCKKRCQKECSQKADSLLCSKNHVDRFIAKYMIPWNQKHLGHEKLEKGVLEGSGQTDVPTDFLPAGERLVAGQKLLSHSRRVELAFQNGNLRLSYRNHLLWEAGTATSTLLVMQPDRNVVLYDSSMKPTWETNTLGEGDAGKLIIQDDCNLVLYQGTQPLWHTETWGCPNVHKLVASEGLEVGETIESPNGQVKLAFQGGSLILSHHGRQLWSSKTTAGTRLIMQVDDNLVIYDESFHPKWATHTWGTGGAGPANLIIQDDCNLVVSKGDRILWETGTQGCREATMAPTPVPTPPQRYFRGQ